MHAHAIRPTLVLVFACALAVLFFLLDIAIPQAHFWARFLLPIVVVFLWDQRPRDIYFVTIFASVLVVASDGFYQPFTFDDLLINHLLPLAVLWAVAWLLVQRQQRHAQLARRERELDAGYKARTAELQASEERYRLLAESTTDVVWTVDLQGRLTYVSPSIARLIGYTRDEMMQYAQANGLPPLLAAPVQEALAAAAAAQTWGEPFESMRFVIPQRHKDGVRLIWTELFFDLLRDGSGETIGLRGTTRDITQRNAAERERLFLSALVASSPDAVVGRQVDGTITSWNRGAEQLFGYTAAEAIGRNLTMLAPPGGRENMEDAMALVAQGKEVEGLETQRMAKEGRVFDCLVSSFPVYDGDGTILGIATFARDISPRKQAERALQALNAELEDRVAARTADLQAALADLQRANRIKDEFMAMISHELRTPLTGVLTLAELLAEQVAGPLTARQSFYVQGIIESGERLLNVINGILSYVYLIAGDIRLQPETCDLAHLLAICAASQQHKAATKGQAIAVCVDPSDLSVTCDAAALADILKRLLDNAVKFTPEGGQIGLEARRKNGANTVELVVWDTGVGVPADQFEHIFKPFTQADGRLARSHEGTGLGLAYATQMVRLLGGAITLASEPGHGSRFTITLPDSMPQ